MSFFWNKHNKHSPFLWITITLSYPGIQDPVVPMVSQSTRHGCKLDIQCTNVNIPSFRDDLIATTRNCTRHRIRVPADCKMLATKRSQFPPVRSACKVLGHRPRGPPKRYDTGRKTLHAINCSYPPMSTRQARRACIVLPVLLCGRYDGDLDLCTALLHKSKFASTGRVGVCHFFNIYGLIGSLTGKIYVPFPL